MKKLLAVIPIIVLVLTAFIPAVQSVFNVGFNYTVDVVHLDPGIVQPTDPYLVSVLVENLPGVISTDGKTATFPVIKLWLHETSPCLVQIAIQNPRSTPVVVNVQITVQATEFPFRPTVTINDSTSYGATITLPPNQIFVIGYTLKGVLVGKSKVTVTMTEIP